MIKLKDLTKKTAEAHCKSGLFMLKFHFCNHVVEHVGLFGNLNFLSASPFKIYNVNMKSAYLRALQRRQSITKETVEMFKNSTAREIKCRFKKKCKVSSRIAEEESNCKQQISLIGDGVRTEVE